jgi:hypothetical protein
MLSGTQCLVLKYVDSFFIGAKIKNNSIEKKLVIFKENEFF